MFRYKCKHGVYDKFEFLFPWVYLTARKCHICISASWSDWHVFRNCFICCILSLVPAWSNDISGTSRDLSGISKLELNWNEQFWTYWTHLNSKSRQIVSIWFKFNTFEILWVGNTVSVSCCKETNWRINFKILVSRTFMFSCWVWKTCPWIVSIL